MNQRTAIPHTATKAFSLVELSIVLVILGLLVGGVLAGQSLIRAADLRSISVDVNRYISAINVFREQYGALPGDMGTASSFWSGAGDGDGNGRISNFPAANTEKWKVWNHLYLAGLVEVAYNGSGGWTDLGVNIPKSRIAQAGFTLIYWDAYTDSNDFSPATSHLIRSHLFMFGKSDGGAETYLPAITPSEAWNIDTKMDDGLILKGKIRAFTNYQSNCATSSNSTVAVYNLSYTSIGCNLGFLADF